MNGLKQELNDWNKVLNEHKTELANITIDANTMSCHDIDKAIERKIFLEQIIKEDKEIINEIVGEINSQ